MNGQKGIRALIVEDDYLVSEMIKGLLQDVGYVVVGEAINGLQAVEMTQSLSPDVVLMDIKMPDMDGVEATRRIYRCRPTPVVVLTAYETPELIERATAAGVGAYLVKPPDANEIERAVTVALARFEDMMELRRLNAELQERNDELDAFAHTVAHDLKSQLTPLIGYAEVLEVDYAATLDPEGMQCIYKILGAGRKMANVTDELLLLAELRAVEAPIEPLNMAAVVREARRRLAYMIEESQAEIILPTSWSTALGYAPWIEEVWVNYLSNGTKYGGRPDEGLKPCLRLGETARSDLPAVLSSLEAQQDQMVCFWIQDNGPGIALSDQAQLFIPFTKIHQVRARGYGLGLSIVRHIVEKLGGQVGVESKVGVGSTFWFALPAT
jgi:signal transduction histidine kinase